MSPLQIGTAVEYRRGWTSRRAYRAVVLSVELSDSDEVVYILSDGHWCYAGQIVGVLSGTKYAEI